MIFHCKHFSIIQKDNEHKVGTDSFLLGSIVNGDYHNILDIGTGTGILALMMAQKNKDAKIIAIEPDSKSFMEADLNFKNSIFSHQIKGFEISLQNFSLNQKFDLIISNPPFFENSFKGQNDRKNNARHTISLKIEEMYEKVKELLDEDGHFCLIIPFELKNKHIDIAKKHNLNLNEEINIESGNNKMIRAILKFGLKNRELKSSNFFLKYSNGKYSSKYIELTKDFHLYPIS